MAISYYIDLIQILYVQTPTAMFEERYNFRHENAAIHTCMMTRTFSETNDIDVTDRPASLTDLNMMGYV